MADPAGPDLRDPAPLPSRVTTPLLTLITQQSLDEDYLHVAERRAAGHGRAPTARPQVRAAIVLALFGLIVMTAVIQTSRNSSTDQAGRASLIERINAERAVGRSLQTRIGRVTASNTAAEETLSAVTAAAVAAQTRLRRVQIRTGYLAVTGPGVRVTVTDPESGEEAVRDTDLRRLVNGLWQAGAEAIAINGQRLTVLTAIRNSGPVVNVNYQPLRPPYVVTAIGDPRTLQADLLDSEGGAEFIGLARQYGFGVDVQNVDDDGLTLPAATQRGLRSAQIAAPSRPDMEDLAP
ncbi:DUF881 domain-containing protein [Nocardioides fonticola]|uniref:DUF881 domain-containing protein n=1 Tax=Nocardioides fonticola TaxID=450363 RepID=A0ABP7XVD7_9ACTN